MDAPLVRAFLASLRDDPPDEKALERVRTCLATLQSPDVRYLVGRVSGSGAAAIARVARAVLEAAGARTGILGRDVGGIELEGGAIDDALLGAAGTLAAASVYQIGTSDPGLGELTRREVVVILGLVAFAEASRRVALLVDEVVDMSDPLYAPRPDLVVIGAADAHRLEAALSRVPEGCPVVVAPLADGELERVERLVTDRGIPALVGGRDYRVRETDGSIEFVVRDEPYVTVAPVPGVEVSDLATGIAAALGLGVLGIRMREDWVLAGIDALRAVPATT